MKLPSITDIDLSFQRVLIREDFNVPIVQGKILSEQRIIAAIPTIEYALQQNAAVILISHLGQPKSTTFSKEFSLKPVASALSRYLNRPVKFVTDWIEGIEIQPGEVALCENVRLQTGEHTNDPTLSKKIAALANIIVMDAFAVAHRISASTVGIIHYAQQACCGLLFQSEIKYLTDALKKPRHPVVAVIGGSKISTKLALLESLLNQVDHLLLGGGMANTFLAAKSLPIGDSLYEPDLIEDAQRLLQLAHTKRCQLHLPQDAVISCPPSQGGINTKVISDIQPYEKICDIGPITRQRYRHAIQQAGTILWNGPMGVFEQAAFQNGTSEIAHAIHESTAFSIAGGGETLAAIERYGVNLSYTSTGGGAFLAFLEGKTLPTVHALQARLKKK